MVFGRASNDAPRTIQSTVVQPDERARLPWAGSARLQYESRGEGLPTDHELQRINKIEDQLINALESQGALFVGHVTGSNRTRVIFYSHAEGPQSVTVKTGLLKKDDVPIEWRQDPEWALYDLELQPTPEEAMADRFRNLWYQLFQHGDNPDLTRQVDFSFVFRDSADRSAFMADANSAGYSSEGEPNPEEGGQFWCEINLTTPISPDVLIPHCVALDEMAKRHDGEFDGWACVVTF